MELKNKAIIYMRVLRKVLVISKVNLCCLIFLSSQL